MTADVKAKIKKAGRRGEDHPLWKGGTWVDSRQERVFVLVPEDERHLHPTIRRDGYIKRYHYTWNTHNPGDPVGPGDIIHHINHIKTDDRIENLQKMASPAHSRHHGLGRTHTEESRQKMRDAQKARRARERAARDVAS